MSFSSGILPLPHLGPLDSISGSFLLAYLDPGTGSFVLQILLAGLMSSLYLARHWWRELRGLLQLRRQND